MTHDHHALWEAIRHKHLMLDAYTRLRNPTFKDGKWGIASNFGRFRYGSSKTFFIFEELVKARDAGRIPAEPVTCETGFNAGHSAILFLDVLPKGKHFEFSWGAAPYAPFEPQNAKLFEEVYAGRFTYTFGDTNVTLREFAKARPEVKCDVIFVDGAKGVENRKNDIHLLRAMSKPGALLFGDEANTAECMSGQVDRSDPLCRMKYETEVAYNELVRAGFLRYVGCSKEKKIGAPRDLVCAWTFAA